MTRERVACTAEHIANQSLYAARGRGRLRRCNSPNFNMHVEVCVINEFPSPRWARQVFDWVRGAVKVVNRKKLEHSACEYYGVIQIVRWRASLEISPEVKRRPLFNCRLASVVVGKSPLHPELVP